MNPMKNFKSFTTLLLTALPLHAEITPDASLGTQVIKIGQESFIRIGTQNGPNLFHSFSNFDINTGEIATFVGPTIIENIINRVTGGTTSNINGLIRSSIPGANLYLLNPAGVLFGPNAALDISGSFHVSSADYINLGNNGRFDASQPINTVLSVAPPSAFGFLGNSPAAIQFSGSDLRTPVGETFSVVAGDITLADASLYASGGQVNVISTASAGEIDVNSDAATRTDNIATLGTLQISDSRHFLDRPKDAQTNFFIGNIDSSGDSAGKIFIRAGEFIADNGAVFSNNTNNTGSGGLVDVNIRNDIILTNESRLHAENNGLGNSPGVVTIKANKLVVESGSEISVRTFRTGAGGEITIDASETISLSGRSPVETRLFGNSRSGIFADTSGTGKAGSISIQSTDLNLDKEAVISSTTFNEGGGGAITLDIDNIRILGGSTIDADSQGIGNGGVITINATDTIEVTGFVPGDTLSNSRINSNAFSNGNGGTVTILAPTVLLTDRGVIQALLESRPFGSQPQPDNQTKGGLITLQAEELIIDSGGQIATSNNTSGMGGDIQIDATNRIHLSGISSDGIDPSLISSAATDFGGGGKITVQTNLLRIEDGALLIASTGNEGNAGDIQISSSSIYLESGGRISTSTEGTGNGSLMNIKAVRIQASGSDTTGIASGLYSDVQVSPGGDPAIVTGTGGDIHLTTTTLNLSDQATLSAKSAGAGNAGNITVLAGEQIHLVNNALITTEASVAGGGKIEVNVQERLILENSGITSSVADGSGNGGDIMIDPVFVVLLDSDIIARADAGNGGNIDIVTDFLIASPGSQIDASSNIGIDGEVGIDATDSEISNSLQALPVAYLDVGALLRNRCATRASASASSFVVASQAGMLPSPEGLVTASYFSSAFFSRLKPLLQQQQQQQQQQVNDNPVGAASAAINPPGQAIALPATYQNQPALLLGCL